MSLEQLFLEWAGEPCAECRPIGANGSSRRYMRMRSSGNACMGAIGTDVRENEAFFSIGGQLYSHGIHVPKVYAIGQDRTTYLQQDLGDTTLYGLLFEKRRNGGGFDAEMVGYYKRVLEDLHRIQYVGKSMDFSKCYPRARFDRRSIIWDLNYFKYNFLKLAHISFDEELLEDDFECLADFLLQADCSYLLYRDFQTRNIMLYEGELYYIDFQGARQGASQYDVASLLYSAKSDIPQAIRTELLEHYLQLVGDKQQRSDWMKYFWGYVLLRIMQAMGAYGYRGLFENKAYFKESIPLAINNLRAVVETSELGVELPELQRVWHRLGQLQTTATSTIDDRLTVEILSFSYKQGLPVDQSGNGGGFIFDCRALPNPGRYAEYKTYTGKDPIVQDFLRKYKEVEDFIQSADRLVSHAIEVYTDRHFTHLQVAFGCTGGQHRSVYCAEMLANLLRKRYPMCHVHLHHREQEQD